MSDDQPTSLQVPESLATILADHDGRSEGFDEAELSFALERALKECGDLADEQRKAGVAEIAAFQFNMEPFGQKSPWHTRYAPSIVAQREDGTTYCFADIALIDGDVIAYWRQRASESSHPILKARYADVVWDLERAATRGKPPIQMAWAAIDSYVDCGKRFADRFEEGRLDRALELALSIGDRGRVDQVIETMLDVLANSEFKGSRAIWLYDTLCDRKGVQPTEEQRQAVIDQLEAELKRICDSPNPVGIVAEGPAARLAKHYERIGRPDESKRVTRAYGEAVLKFAGTAKGMVAQHWLQEVYTAYMQRGLGAEAEQIKTAMKEKGKEAQSEMVRMTHSVEIPDAEMEEFLHGLVGDGLEAALVRIANWFCPQLSEIEKQLKETKRQAKLLSMIPFAKVGEDQVVARAGSIENDPVGRAMIQMTDNIKGIAGLLGLAIDRIRRDFDVTAESVLAFLYQSPFFDPDRKPLLEHGIDAYLQGDHVKAIHVLVPQVEHVLRRLLAMLGGATNKHRRSDLRVMVEKSLNDILEAEPAIQKCLGDDITMYLRVFLCDPLGFNLRNNLAHGLMQPEAFRSIYADRLLHILLVLGMFPVHEPRSDEGEGGESEPSEPAE